MGRAAQDEAAGGQAALAGSTTPDLVILERVRTALRGAGPGEATPAWLPVAWAIIDRILSGDLMAGEVLPSACQLAADLGTSAYSAGCALQVLAAASVLHRSRRDHPFYYVRGSFVLDAAAPGSFGFQAATLERRTCSLLHSTRGSL